MADNFDRTAILESFLDEVNAYLPDIQADLDRLQQTPGDTRALEESFRRTHTIAGSAAMMEFQALAHVASGMEGTLGEALAHQRPLDAPTVALLRRSLGRLERLIAGIRSNTDGANVAAEDDADRVAWRGTGAVGAGRLGEQPSSSSTPPGFAPPGMSGSAYATPDGAAAYPGGPQGAGRSGVLSAPLQMPEWLAAFAASNGDSGNSGNNAASSGTSGPGTAFGASGLTNLGGFNGPSSSVGMSNPNASYASQPTPGGMPAPGQAWDEVPTMRPAPSPAGQSFGASQPGAAPMGWQGPTNPGVAIYDETTIDMSHMGTEAMPTVPHGGPYGSPLSSVPSSPSSVPSGPSVPSIPGGQGSSAPSWSASASIPMRANAGPMPSSLSGALPGDLAAERTLPVPAVAAQAQPFGAPLPGTGASPIASGGTDESALDELRADTLAVQAQVNTLRGIIRSVEDAIQEAESERLGLRGFLDSSSDAIDRLEAWAQQQAGINLPPTQMREQLPLAIIYVITTRLKRLSDMLRKSGTDLRVSEEQIDETLNELRRAIDQTGHLYRSVTQVGGTPEQGFQATVAQFAWTPPATPANPAAVESLTPAARAEIEREARDTLRRELEDEVRAEVALDVRRDETQRLRHELEIEVRRELLKEIMPDAGTSLTDMRSLAESMARMPIVQPAPRRVQVTSEQSPEALEVFRDEAMEHLQTITNGITSLERHPAGQYDEATLREMRRAMHTLKGAAGAMGYTTIQGVAHASEDVLERMAEGTATFNPAVLGLLLDTTESLDQMISGRLTDPEEQRNVARDLIARYSTFGGSIQPSVVDADSGTPTSATMHGQAEMEEADEALTATSPDLSVRLQVRELDQLISLYGELVSTRAVLEERLSSLDKLVTETVHVSERLHAVGGQLETQFEAATLPVGGPSAPTPLAPGFAPGYGGQPGMPGMMPGMAQEGPYFPGTGYQGMPPYPGAPARPGYAPPAGGMRRPAGAGQRQPAHAGEFDELELDRYTEFHRLSRGLSEGIADAGHLSHEMEQLMRDVQTTIERESRLSTDFQARLLKAGLVKIQTLAPRLLRAARTTATKAGKEIEFYIEGGDTEVERRVSEQIEGALLHLVRNAVVHGIETPEERERAGKPRAGRIILSARYESNQVAITVSDDGAGIDPQRVRTAALEHGWADESTLATSRDALEFIFRPGVTTAASVTEESGRGVGLDVVRDVATRLRGTAEVDSHVGQGTMFTLKLPINLQIASALVVRVGQQMVAIPMFAMGEIARMDSFPRVPGNERAIDVHGQQFTLIHLASYLNTRPDRIDGRTPLLLITAGRQRIALLFDEIQSQKEIVAKPLGPHLRDVRGIAGATILGSGQVVLILDMQELLSSPPRGEVAIPAITGKASEAAMGGPAVEHASQAPAAGPGGTWGQSAMRAAAAPTAPNLGNDPSHGFVVTTRDPFSAGIAVGAGGQASYLLVVDDSPTVRRVVGGMLKSRGWRVETARDGIEALEMIGRERPAAVLLDIEMPRMDGYELMATVRSQDALRTLPLVVLTSRAAAKHRQRAHQLGADAYIVKPYQDDELLSTIARLAQAQG